MSNVLITFKVMPSSPDVNLDALQSAVEPLIVQAGGSIMSVEIEPVAFGLKAIMMKFAMDESKGSTDELEEQIAAMETVASVSVAAVSRALG